MIDIEYVKEMLDKTSVARQILSIDNLAKGYSPRYEVNNCLYYIDRGFKINKVGKEFASIQLPIIESSITSSSGIDAVEYFKLMEDKMFMAFLDYFTPKRIFESNLVDCIDYAKKQIYATDMRPRYGVVSKNVFDNLFRKTYLLKYCNPENVPCKYIDYDNIRIYPLDLKNDNMFICFTESYFVGTFCIANKMYKVNDTVFQNIGMFFRNSNVSFAKIDSRDLNRILSNTGGNCKKCGIYDEYAPLDEHGKCLCYLCYKPF